MDIVSNVDKVEILGNGRYRIPSQTVEGKMYTTVAGEEAAYCDCPWSRKGTRMCKHIHAARIFNAMSELAAGALPDGGPDPTGPRKGSELSEDIPECCTECLSTRFREASAKVTPKIAILGRGGL